MPDTNLPPASSAIKTFKVGSFDFKTEKPRESAKVIQQALDGLEKAARERVFAEDGESEE